MEQAPERQVHGSYGAPFLEYGTQHQSVRPQAVRDDQVSRGSPLRLRLRRLPSLISRTRWIPIFKNISGPVFLLSQVLPAADVEAVPVGEGSLGVSR